MLFTSVISTFLGGTMPTTASGTSGRTCAELSCSSLSTPRSDPTNGSARLLYNDKLQTTTFQRGSFLQDPPPPPVTWKMMRPWRAQDSSWDLFLYEDTSPFFPSERNHTVRTDQRKLCEENGRPETEASQHHVGFNTGSSRI